MRFLYTTFMLLSVVLVSGFAFPSATFAQGTSAGPITITHRPEFIAFPDRISFNAQITSTTPIEQVVLEYGVVKRTCGDIVAKAFPNLTPATTVEVNWTWEMLQTGSEPPGSTIWYRWRATDRAGNTALSEEKRVTWRDQNNPWQQISQGDVTLHWYAGSTEFANELLATATDGLAQLDGFTGVRPLAPIDIYIYANTREMRDAILYEPSWAGGVAYPANNITIIGISPYYLDWGKRTIVHELTHLIVGQITFSCGENVPTWLDEGIAVFAEGGLDDYSQADFQQAVANNTLLSVRSISNGFSQHPDLADLSYSQSFSLVDYLVRAFGKEKLLGLFASLRDGMTVEAGLQANYGFDLDGLEDRWRAAIGAAARQQLPVEPTAPPTIVPTAQPMAVVPVGPTRMPTPTGLAPRSASSAQAAVPTPTAAVAGGIAPAELPAPAPAAVVPVSPFDPRMIGAVLVFLVGLSLSGLAAWKLFGVR
jgi:hypothetical protein